MAKYFNKNLKYIRKLYNISQQKIADDLPLNINRSTISRWEKGEIDVPLEVAMQIADYIGISYEEFFATDLTKKTKNEISKLKNSK